MYVKNRIYKFFKKFRMFFFIYYSYIQVYCVIIDYFIRNIYIVLFVSIKCQDMYVDGVDKWINMY